MFRSHLEHKALNQAVDSEADLLKICDKLRTVPELKFNENEVMSRLFFNEASQDLALINEHKINL